jgi:hypothetical protein
MDEGNRRSSSRASYESRVAFLHEFHSRAHLTNIAGKDKELRYRVSQSSSKVSRVKWWCRSSYNQKHDLVMERTFNFLGFISSVILSS